MSTGISERISELVISELDHFLFPLGATPPRPRSDLRAPTVKRLAPRLLSFLEHPHEREEPPRGRTSPWTLPAEVQPTQTH